MGFWVFKRYAFNLNINRIVLGLARSNVFGPSLALNSTPFVLPSLISLECLPTDVLLA